MDRLCAETGARSAVLQGLNLVGSHATTFWMTHDSRIDMAMYRSTISDRGNARLESKRFFSSSSGLVNDDDLFASDEHAVRSRLHRQLFALGLGRFLGAGIQLAPNRYATIALHKDVADAQDFSGRQRARLAALMPHFAQALLLSQSITTNRLAEVMLRSHLEHSKCGLIVCNLYGEVRWLNRRARSELTSGGGLALRDGHLQATNQDSQRRLAQAMQVQHAGDQPAFLGIESAGRRYQLVLQALEDTTESHVETQILVTLSSEQSAEPIPVAALMALFRLTEAESRLTSALVAGTTLREYAMLRGVSLGTVRFQFKQVLQKTGASRQADLVRRLLCSAVAHVSRQQCITP